jgi:hypothetical protein
MPQVQFIKFSFDSILKHFLFLKVAISQVSNIVSVQIANLAVLIANKISLTETENAQFENGVFEIYSALASYLSTLKIFDDSRPDIESAFTDAYTSTLNKLFTFLFGLSSGDNLDDFRSFAANAETKLYEIITELSDASESVLSTASPVYIPPTTTTP